MSEAPVPPRGIVLLMDGCQRPVKLLKLLQARKRHVADVVLYRLDAGATPGRAQVLGPDCANLTRLPSLPATLAQCRAEALLLLDAADPRVVDRIEWFFGLPEERL